MPNSFDLKQLIEEESLDQLRATYYPQSKIVNRLKQIEEDRLAKALRELEQIREDS